ncbi:MAG TPA: 4-hydroxy-tetrahydrodipicolinate reductase [Steroidobacteraceae bacterium]|nr:4-hydroxy-tetrahydrodipicolinate reductase [Steroidobacteraceae bacterium]
MPGAAIFGVTGRMGQCLVRALAEGTGPSRLTLSGALASPGSARLGQDAAGEGRPPSGVLITADPRIALAQAAVALDFSHPQSLPEHLEACLETGTPLLIGTTGHRGRALEVLEGTATATGSRANATATAAAARIPLLIAPNTSLGVAVLARLVAIASGALGEAVDVEIAEIHHRAKRDAPSGTALALAEVVAAARAASLEQFLCKDRATHPGPRAPGSIGLSSLRAGDIVGEHTVMFAGPGERLELTHRATDRMIFARGALAAARWLIGRPPGRYSMSDVLGF